MIGKSARRACGGALVVSLLFVRTPAHAGEPAAEAEALIQHGVELRRAGRNGEALSEFQRANALAPSPRAKAQVALALHALGDWLGAESGLEQALVAADDPWIVQYRDALEGALATVRAHLGRLSIVANVPVGEVLLNGVRVRALPLTEPIRVPAGKVDVAVRAPGYAPAERTIEILPGTEAHEEFLLQLLPPQRPADSAPPSRAPVAASPSIPRGAPARARPLGYAALAGAGLLAVGGIVAWRVHEDDAAIFDDDSRCLVGTRTRGQQCGAYEGAANEALAVEIGAFAIAGGAAALGAWLLIPTMSNRPRLTASCAPWGGVGLTCSGAF